MLGGIRPHKPEFAYDNVRIDSQDIHGPEIEYEIVGKTKAPLLRCFPFTTKLKAGDIISTGQYMNYQTSSNLHFRRVLKNSFQVEIAFYRVVCRQRGRGFGALAQVFGRNAIPILRKYIVPAAKRVGADLLEFVVPENAEVVIGRKNFKTAAKSVGRQTLRKQVGSGYRKRTASRVIPTKSVKQTSRSRKHKFTIIFH